MNKPFMSSLLFIAWLLYATIILSERKTFGKNFASPERPDMNKALRTIDLMHGFLLIISFSAVATWIWVRS